MDGITATIKGLTSEQVSSRLATHGPNTINETAPFIVRDHVLSYLKEPFSLVLAATSILSYVLKEPLEGTVLLAILLLTLTLNVYQEKKAHTTFMALRAMLPRRVRVWRDSVLTEVDAKELVPGDLIELSPGERIPADGKIIEGRAILVNESLLTGESTPVEKEKAGGMMVLVDGSDRESRRLGLFAGTTLVRGEATLEIEKTGPRTRFAQVVHSAEDIADQASALQGMVKKITTWMIVIGVVLIGLVIIVGMLRGAPWHDMLQLGTALLVSVLPEGLPLLVTLVLALGMYAMGKQGVLVKRMDALTSLGQVSHLAFDKTGTLTLNELMVTDLVMANGSSYGVSGKGYEREGELFDDQGDVLESFPFEIFFMGGLQSLAAHADVVPDPDRSGDFRVSGDPTEAAMRVFGEKFTYSQGELRTRYPLVNELPFDHKRKYYATVFQISPSKHLAVVSGAAEVVLGQCSAFLAAAPQTYHIDFLEKPGFKNSVLSDDLRAQLSESHTKLSKEAKRMIGISVVWLGSDPEITHADLERGIYIGAVGMQDAVRSDAAAMVGQVKRLGLAPVMITGDHAVTAGAIATKVGLIDDATEVATPDTADPEQLGDYHVWARVHPEEKKQIVESYKKEGITLAMTGDGVNDVPSLVAADIGIAMGIKGTDAAREAADMILLDDQLSDIPEAFHEGRRMISVVWFVMVYLVGTNILEMILIAGLSLVGIVEPMTPLQILWINVVTDIALVIPFVYDAMQHDPSRGLLRYVRTLDIGQMFRVFWKWFGGLVALGVMVLVIGAALARHGVMIAPTILFLLLLFFQVVHMALIPNMLGLGNITHVEKFPRFAAMMIVLIIVHILLFAIPGLRNLFSLVTPSPADWVLLLSLGAATLFVGRTTLVGRWLRF